MPSTRPDTAAVLTVSKQVGVGRSCCGAGAPRPRLNVGEAPGITTEENEEIRRLREDVAILKAATTFFAGEPDPRNGW
ncbi:hypothetical protein ACGFXB_44520 [Streptomyces canus]|uniref:hypothetical protein n=1 Tax=Streptomyces canus TaxID=58343 RepID=UPI00371FAF17